jgi:predicted lipoprotein with Yx(FWY)xxD motif
MRPAFTMTVASAAAAILLAACSGAASPSPASSASPGASTGSGGLYGNSSPSASAGASAAASAGASDGAVTGATVMTADSAFGTILVDGAGRTLYVFLKDTSSDSTCYDACAASWPALTTSDAITPGSGLDASAFSTTTRTDGTTQVTFYGHPLYYFAGDQAAGDTNGQGLNSVWYVVDPTGTAIKGG